MVPITELFLMPIAGAQSGARLRVVYGAFENAQQALNAEQRLPPKYQREFRPSPRSFAELRNQL